jgi:hypothetical protein
MPSLREKVSVKSPDIKETVEKLLMKATSNSNLSQLYPGKNLIIQGFTRDVLIQ